MTRLTTLLLSTALTLPVAAFADITPQEVWDNMIDASQGYGTSITADLEEDGTTLIARNITMIPTLGISGDDSMQAIFPEVILEGLSDGTVKISIPQAASYSMQLLNEFEGEVQAAIEVQIDGSTIVSGSPDDVLYTLDDNAVTYNATTTDPSVLNVEQVMKMAVSGISGTYAVQQRDDDVFSDFNINAASVSYDANMKAEDAPVMDMTYNAGPLAIVGTAQADTSLADDPAKIMQSLGMDMTYSIGKSEFALVIADGGQETNITGTTGSNDLTAQMKDGVIAYQTASHDLEAFVSGSAIPFPQVDFGAKTMGFAVEMPYVGNGEAQPASLGLNIEELRLPAIAWALLDPQNELPHDPATLRLDLSGNVISEINLFDPASIESLVDSETFPGQPLDVDLNELFLSIAGAQLSASGKAAFDEDGAKAPNGMPAVDADLHVELSGATAVIETLAGLGVIPAEMVAASQMMLTMFARPTDTPDGFETDVTLTKDGTLNVNGTPLPF